jgi:hypothetical protein
VVSFSGIDVSIHLPLFFPSLLGGLDEMMDDLFSRFTSVSFPLVRGWRSISTPLSTVQCRIDCLLRLWYSLEKRVWSLGGQQTSRWRYRLGQAKKRKNELLSYISPLYSFYNIIIFSVLMCNNCENGGKDLLNPAGGNPTKFHHCHKNK